MPPLNQLQNQNRQIVSQTTTVAYSGPLPPANELAKYEQIIPGAAERILKMAEDQSSHRRSLETKVIDSGINNSKRGLNFGLITALVAIVASVFVTINGYPATGAVIGGSYLVTAVSAFVYGSQHRKKERAEQKQKQ